MGRVVLVSPPFLKDYMRNARCDFVSLSNSSWYPIWLGQAGALLESHGHSTWLYDAQVEGQSFAAAIQAIRAYKPDFVAVYSGRLSENSDIAFAEELEKLGLRTVFVGPYASINPNSLLQKTKNACRVIQREFDLPLLEWVNGANENSINNFVLKNADALQFLPLRPLYKQETLDSFPLLTPYFHKQLNLRNYKTPSELFPFIDVLSGRGCAWGRCNFCLWVQTFVPGTVYNQRSIAHFLGEFSYIEKNLPQVRSVMIQDDMLTEARAAAISEGLLAMNFKRRWSCYAKPNSKLTLQTLKLMKRSGCLNLHVGFESGDDEILKTIDKGSTVEQARELASLAHQAGLYLHADFAMGHFGETKASIAKTIRLAKEINPHTAQFQLMIPFPETKFWHQLENSRLKNSSGEPSYEEIGGASASEIRAAAKRAYREFYISPRHIKKVLSDPRNYLFNRLDQYAKAIPAVFWRDWIR